MQSGAAGHPHQQRGAQSILITDAAPRFRNRVPRGAGVRTVLLRALLGVHLGAVARSRSLERPERIPVAAAAPPAARSEYYRGAACGYLALLPAPHPAGLAGPEAPCPRRLGSKHPGAQRRQPAKQREVGQRRAARLGLVSRCLGGQRWVTRTVPSVTEGRVRIESREEEEVAARCSL